MYGYLNYFLVFSAMVCSTTPYGDLFNRPTQRSADPSYAPNFQQNRDFSSTDRREISQAQYQQNGPNTRDLNSHVEQVRHTLTSTRVDMPAYENLHSAPTTVRNYVNKSAVSTKNYFNATSSPDLGSKSSGKRKSQEYEDDSKMVYPSDIEDEEDSTSINQIHSRNCSYGLCDEVDNYPTEKIYRILNRSKELRQFFSTKITEVIPTTVVSRFGENAPEALCTTMTHTRFPKTAVNMNNMEQLLVNVDNFKQGIVYETCISNGGACNFSQDFPQNYVSTCTQKYTVRKLMVVGKESDNPIFDDFKIPSCCVCTVTKVTGGKT